MAGSYRVFLKAAACEALAKCRHRVHLAHVLASRSLYTCISSNPSCRHSASGTSSQRRIANSPARPPQCWRGRAPAHLSSLSLWPNGAQKIPSSAELLPRCRSRDACRRPQDRRQPRDAMRRCGDANLQKPVAKASTREPAESCTPPLRSLFSVPQRASWSAATSGQRWARVQASTWHKVAQAARV